MIDDSTLGIIRALARGIDPSTGESLPADHLCQKPATVRALGIALSAIESASEGPHARRPVAGAKAGMAWAPADDEALALAYDRGEAVGKLAQDFQRSRGAITARLVRLGKLEAAPGMRLRGSPAQGERDRIEIAGHAPGRGENPNSR